MAKKFIGVRMSESDEELLNTLKDRLGATQGSVLAMGLRELARKEQVQIPVLSTSEASRRPYERVGTDVNGS